MLAGNGSGLGSSLHEPWGERAHGCKLLNLVRGPGLTLVILIFGL